VTKFVKEIARQSGARGLQKPVAVGLRGCVTGLRPARNDRRHAADSDIGVSKGDLFDNSRQLSALIGRPTAVKAETNAAAIKS